MDFKLAKEKGLYVEEYVILYIIYHNIDWNTLTWVTDNISLQNIFQNLEQEMWIIPSSEEHGGYKLRGKALELFESKDDVKEIISYLNLQTGKNFKANAGTNRTLISARLGEGYTVVEIKKMIDTMVTKWFYDRKMNMYLRPETLFNATKFQTYINEIPKQDPSWANERV